MIEEKGLHRRSMLGIDGALPLFSILSSRAWGAPLEYKFATGQDPSHPLNMRIEQANKRIFERSGGDLKISLFPANQLGPDTELLSQIRMGSIDFLNISASILSTLIPGFGITNMGFAFPDYAAVWKTMDGPLGKRLTGQAEKFDLVLIAPFLDNGFRQITTSTHPIRSPADLESVKLRVPPSPTLLSLFKALGANPTPLNFNEVYMSLQTRIIDGQENPLAIIATTRLYEVQKYCSMTDHVWDGYCFLANGSSWRAIPEKFKDIVKEEYERAALEERQDVAALNEALKTDLEKKGLVFNTVDREPFRLRLREQRYYAHWKAKFGERDWQILEEGTGRLL